MRVPRFCLALLVSATALLATDPIVGTWTYQHAASKGALLPKSSTVVITEEGDTNVISVNAVSADGSPFVYKYTLPKKGGAATNVEGAFDAVSGKLVNPLTRDMVYMRGGKQVRSAHVVVAKNGKTMKTTIKNMDANGKAVTVTQVYTKQ